MSKTKRPIDKVRASRDGHEYHEAWAARHAMRILLPNSDLVGIAIEGLEPGDQRSASEETIEIADLAFYYGRRASFNGARKVCIAQFKYSIRDRSNPFRAADAKKTIEKFGKAFRSLRGKYGAPLVRKKVAFELHTNRPIYSPLVEALDALATGTAVSGEVKKQADQLKLACGLTGTALSEFAGKCSIQSLNDTLRESKAQLSSTIVDWFGNGSDAIARASLGDLKQMIRDKAGFAGTDRNIIEHTDILAALGLSDSSDLLPCPEALADVGDIVEREQLGEAVSLVANLDKPLMVRAAGGTGKTVFLDSICKSLSNDHETVFFDCFGGGNYRSPGDARHHPRRGFIHIANTLACRGLCDPIIPGSDDIDSLINTFRRRIEQSVATLASSNSKKSLVLFIDAIDNAAIHAKDKREDSFPVLLVEHLNANPVPGFKVVLSSRTERIPISDNSYVDFALRNFSLDETKCYLQARIPDVRESEIRVAQARSQGTPRILQYMLDTERGLLDESEINKKIVLNDLIQGRIDSALDEARQRGSKTEEINSFLAGLAVLPPPVPLNEYAQAHGMAISAIESFASDLSPLLERTKHGLIFRDEPTEDLVRERYGCLKTPLRFLAKNLLKMQAQSVYAARSLPDLLLLLGDARKLFTLAFDQTFPKEVTGSVGKRNIRLSRLKAAIRHAALEKNYDQLVELTVEMSTVAAVDRRGTDYILDFPDLVIAAQDTDATRRLFEARTGWQGTRHARLAIANTLSGDHDEALRHILATEDWVRHFHKQDRDDRPYGEGPKSIDNASVTFYLLGQKRFEDAANTLDRWYDWYTYKICEHVFGFVSHPQSNIEYCDVKGFLNVLSSKVGALTAALAHLDLKPLEQKALLSKISKAASDTDKIDVPVHGSRDTGEIINGFRKAASLALALQDRRSAKAIGKLLPTDRAGLWLFRDHYSEQYVFPFIFGVALNAAIKDIEVHEKDLMPSELRDAASGIKNSLAGIDFRQELEKRLAKRIRTGTQDQEKEKKPGSISYEDNQHAERFLNYRFEPLLDLTRKLSIVLRKPKGRADKAFKDLVKSWVETRKERDYYRAGRLSPFFTLLGLQLIQFTLWARDDLKAASVKTFLNQLHDLEIVSTSTLIELVSIFSKRSRLHDFAGQEAIRCASLIGSENEIDYRASLYARLGRAILPASMEESAEYFRAGLEQMDAIGSGDYQYTNHLFILAASVKGAELKEADFHTLSNIAELNLTDEPEKFPWYAFGQGMSRVSGCRGLAKLSRWDDRDKVTLDCTLRPYLTALVEDDKVAPEDAVALNWLADPADYWSCNTETFAKALAGKNSENKKQLVTELVEQFEANNPGLSTESTVKALAEISRSVLGTRSKIVSRLNSLYPHFGRVINTRNEHANYRSSDDLKLRRAADKREAKSQSVLTRVANSTRPGDYESLSSALAALSDSESAYRVKDDFFDKLRVKVGYGERAAYVRNISGSEHLNLYWKLDELKKCNELWSVSSGALKSVYRQLANALIFQHLDDLISNDSLSIYHLADISELSGLPLAELVLEIVKLFSEPESSVGAPVWLDFAHLICEQAGEGKGQAALTRLLRSDAAKLSGSVLDGEWKNGLYPKNKQAQIFAGLVWRQLGSPRASDRWRAAHCIRSFARFGKWRVVDALLAQLENQDAGPFHAPELRFYYLHAKLWLLIAIARISKDHPAEVSRYKSKLDRVLDDSDVRHVLMRHFAAKALITCIEAREITVSTKRESELRSVDQSPYPLLEEKLKKYNGDYHENRPKAAPKRAYDFSLEYDFNKEDVHYLSNVFGQPHWLVVDLISDIVHDMDDDAKSMYASGGRDGAPRARRGLSSAYHSYGEQLAWHGMMIAAGQLQKTKPATQDWWCDDPWNDWLSRYLLTRDDGVWISDILNRAPPEVTSILMERGKDGLGLTGDKRKILGLAGLDNGIDKSVVVAGSWFSADHIRVQISSALVRPREAKAVIKSLQSDDPMCVWLPSCAEDDDGKGYINSEKSNCLPWITMPGREPRLDGDDPIASAAVLHKPRIAIGIADSLNLKSRGPFGCSCTARGRLKAESEAWAYSKSREGGSGDGHRLVVNKALLEKLLVRNNSDLILLINLQKHESGYRYESGKYWHTVAVVRIKKSLKIEYFKGVINHIWSSNY
ncbi:hypothetical protein DOK_05425 [gamma proteobacterium BDW918]|uniref:NACHT domain-containing protein n=2 Tax=Zhongshania TaxID=1434050 RepID=A0A127M240_9GAMM|nr:hypothetical protein [Zhongshania aliphaticivorans]AMO67284.1 hypothetical protein AZF00_02755 [Zhongshania aliphaticivorans]EIF44048.1 hypothetical protein DOK_05425 [gamma proteobacterium BDW918]